MLLKGPPQQTKSSLTPVMAAILADLIERRGVNRFPHPRRQAPKGLELKATGEFHKIVHKRRMKVNGKVEIVEKEYLSPIFTHRPDEKQRRYRRIVRARKGKV